MADVDVVGENDETVEGAIPVRLVGEAEGIPREYAIAICQKQAVDRKVAANGNQTVLLTLMRVGEP